MVRERPPGWYPDAAKPGHERWWDGGEWSHVTRPAPGATAAGQVERAPAPVAAGGQYPWSAGPSAEGGQPGQPGQGGPSGYQLRPRGYGGLARLTPDGFPLAGPGARLLARIVDGIVLLVIGAAVGFTQLQRMASAVTAQLETMQRAVEAGNQVSAMQIYSDLMADQTYMSAATWFAVIQLVLSAIYHTSFVALRGATPGKLLVGVRVRPWVADGRPTWGQAVLRWAATDLGTLLPLIGAVYTLIDRLWLLWDDRRQCLHDKPAGTCVVRTR
jgi:uncharacterized RDD family membrane protein YckC